MLPLIAFPEQPRRREAGGEEQRHLQQIDPDQPIMAFERDIEAIAQDVLGITLVDPEPRQFGLVDQDPADVAPEKLASGVCGSGCSSAN